MGLFASLHCAAMCGPLVAASSCRGGVLDRRAVMGYFGARLLAYATVGAVLGHLGKHALCILPAGVIATVAAVVVALFALARGLTILLARGEAPPITLGRGPRVAGATLASAVAAFLPRRGAALGAATAILPCGALLPAWLLAASTSSPLAGAAAMATFASASAGGLLLPILGRRLASRVVARLPRSAHGIVWLLLAAWMAARPLLAAARTCH
jgi:hypothetical protein